MTPGPVAPTYGYKWTIRRNNALVLKEGKLDLSAGSARIEIVSDQPEMIYVAVEAAGELVAGTTETGKEYVGGNKSFMRWEPQGRPRS